MAGTGLLGKGRVLSVEIASGSDIPAGVSIGFRGRGRVESVELEFGRFKRSPTLILFGSVIRGFATNNSAVVRPLRAAIFERVSPAFTVYVM
jgi:hypothetical protein